MTPDDRERRAEARLALEDAHAAHQVHDLDTGRAFLATAGIFDVEGDELWFPARRRGPRGEELRTTDPKAARYLPDWLSIRGEIVMKASAYPVARRRPRTAQPVWRLKVE